MMAVLRKLGLSVEINRAKLHLMDDFVVCQRGEPITAEQAKVLVHLEQKIAKFSVDITCR